MPASVKSLAKKLFSSKKDASQTTTPVANGKPPSSPLLKPAGPALTPSLKAVVPAPGPPAAPAPAVASAPVDPDLDTLALIDDPLALFSDPIDVGPQPVSPNRYTRMLESHPKDGTDDIRNGCAILRTIWEPDFAHQVLLFSMEEPLAQFPESTWWPKDMFAGDGYPRVAQTFGLGGQDGRAIRLKRAKMTGQSPEQSLSSRWAKLQLGTLFREDLASAASNTPMFQPLTSRIGLLVNHVNFTPLVAHALFGGFTCNVEVYKLDSDRRPSRPKPRQRQAIELPPARSKPLDDEVSSRKDDVQTVKEINGLAVLFLACVTVEDNNAATKLLHMPEPVSSIIAKDLCTHSLGGFVPREVLEASINLYRWVAPDITNQRRPNNDQVLQDVVQLRFYQLFSLLLQHHYCLTPYDSLSRPGDEMMINLNRVFVFGPEADKYCNKAYKFGDYYTSYYSADERLKRFRDPRQNKVMGFMYGTIVAIIVTHELEMIKPLRSKTDRKVSMVDFGTALTSDLLAMIPRGLGSTATMSKVVSSAGGAATSLLLDRCDKKVAPHIQSIQSVLSKALDQLQKGQWIFGTHINVAAFYANALNAIIYVLQLQDGTSFDPEKTAAKLQESLEPPPQEPKQPFRQPLVFASLDNEDAIRTQDEKASYDMMWLIFSRQNHRVFTMFVPHFMIRHKDDFILRFAAGTRPRVKGNASDFLDWLTKYTLKERNRYDPNPGETKMLKSNGWSQNNPVPRNARLRKQHRLKNQQAPAAAVVLTQAAAHPPPAISAIDPTDSWMAFADRDYSAGPGSAQSLSFHAGDSLCVVEHHDDEWVLAQLNGKHGYARYDYFRVVARVTATCDFETAEPTATKVVTGDVLDVLGFKPMKFVCRFKDNRTRDVDMGKVKMVAA